MNLNEIESKCFIMALFIRDDGLRFLLGSGAYEFKDSQLMFAGNTIENDVVAVQGNDGYMLAGQVRRPSTQVFDGYIGDASVPKSEVEGYRRDFMAFFQKNHFYTVVYVMADGSAIQRRRGFLVDAPTSQELWQMYPEYHVALNFEDVNYYKYSENDEGEETYAKSADIGLAKVQYGGLIWDNNSEIEISGSGTNIELNYTIADGAIKSVEMYGDTQQQTYSGKNLCNGINQGYWLSSTATTAGMTSSDSGLIIPVAQNTRYTISTTTSQTRYRVAFSDSVYASTQLTCYNGANRDGTSDSIVRGSETHSYLIVNATDLTKIQVEKGNQATSFEPYVGGTASPNPDYPQEVKTVTGEQTVTVMDSTQGKNIWKLPPSTSTVNNVEYTPNEDGTFDLVGLASADAEFSTIMRADALGIKEGETYTFSSNGSSILYFVFNCDVNGTWKKTLMGFSPNNSSVTSTCPSLVDSYVRLVIRVSNGTNINQTNVKSMLEKGNQATPFVPYAIQTYPINLGKNLFNIDGDLSYGGYPISPTNNGDGTLTTTANYNSQRASGQKLNLEPNTTYTVSGKLVSHTGTGNVSVVEILSGTIGGVTVIKREYITTDGSFSYSVTTPNDVSKLWVSFSSVGTGTQATFGDIQIEKGSTATTYAPYFTPIELCKIGTYQDYIYKSGEDWYVHKETAKVTFTGAGTETWSSATAATGYIRFSTASGETHADNNGYCNEFINRGSQSHGAYEYVWVQPSANAFYIQVLNTRANDLSSFRTWLGANPATVYYDITTPTDTKITNADLIAQLDALNEATTYDGKTIITVSSENLASPLEITVISIGGGGVVWDENGAEWEAGGGGEIVIVNVDSIENILPVWTIRGEAENPTLTNLTTGMSITYNGTVASGQTLVIDLLNKTAKLNGTSVISDVSGQWVEFKPGNNRVSYSTENANAPDSTIEWQEVVG